MKSLLGLIGLNVPAWVVELVAIVALAGGAVLYFEHRGAAHELVKLQTSSAKLVAKANTDIVDETTQHVAADKANQEKLNAALTTNTALQSQLADSVRGFDAYRRAHPDVARPSGGPVAAVSGECGARSCGDLAQELAGRGNELANAVGQLDATLSACQRDRDSLNGLPH